MVIYQSLKLSSFTLSLTDVKFYPLPLKKVKPTSLPSPSRKKNIYPLLPQKRKTHPLPLPLRKEKHTSIKRVENGRAQAKEAPSDTRW